MRVIGLTGGIASGKSLATDIFKSLNVPIIDADCVAKSLIDTNLSLRQSIFEHFGEIISNDQDTINRQALANIIFSQANERLWLNQLLHPLIRKSMIEQIDIAKKSNNSPYCLCVIPLLAENWPLPFIDEVLLIDTDPTLQLKRLCERDALNKEQARQRLSAQCSQQERRQVANTIITNHSSKDQLRKAIIQWHEKMTFE